MTKVEIFSGFLGAGKTTLIKKLLAEGVYEGEKLVLIENEFGEVGIDGGFLKDSKIEVSELNSGCICCSLAGDFTENMKKVIDEYHPDRIIIEPSGVAGLSDVELAIKNAAENHPMEICAKVVVVNAKRAAKQMKAFGEFFNDQLENATTIVLSRTGELDDAKLDECIKLIKEKNHDANIITTPWENIEAKKIADAFAKVSLVLDDEHEHHHHEHEHEQHHHDHDHDHEHEHEHEHHHHDHDHDHEHHHHHEHGEDCDCGCHDHDHDHHHHHHADDAFVSVGIETAHKFDKDLLTKALDSLTKEEKYECILRAKGIVELTDGNWIQFDMVPGDYEIREGSADYTGRLVVIGTTVDEADVKALFGIC